MKYFFYFVVFTITLPNPFAVHAQNYKFPDISYLSPDTLISIRDFHYSKELKSIINSNKIDFKIIHENVHKNTSVKNFYVEFTVSPNVKIYNKKILNGNASFAGYNPDEYASVKNNNQKLIFNIPVRITPNNARYIWFHVVPYLNGKGKVTAKFKYTDSNGKTVQGTINSGELVSKTPDVKWFLEKRRNGKYNIVGKMIYDYDFQAYAPEDNNEYNLVIDGKKINSRVINRKSDFDYLVANGTITHEENGTKTKTVWKLNKTKLYVGSKKTKPVPKPPDLCTRLNISALKLDTAVIITWTPFEPKNEYEVYRKQINLENPSNAFKVGNHIGVTSNNNFLDKEFENLPNSNYYIYYVRKKGENIYNPSLPVFKHNPFKPEPVFRLNYFEVELGIGINIINNVNTEMLYCQATASQLRFNNYFAINPVNLRLQTDFNNSYGLSLYSLFVISKGILNYEFGGGILILNSKNKPLKYGPELEGGIVINKLAGKSYWKNLSLHIFGKYSVQYQRNNYSGIFFGVNYIFN